MLENFQQNDPKLHNHDNVKKFTLEVLAAADYSVTDRFGKENVQSMVLTIMNMVSNLKDCIYFVVSGAPWVSLVSDAIQIKLSCLPSDYQRKTSLSRYNFFFIMEASILFETPSLEPREFFCTYNI